MEMGLLTETSATPLRPLQILVIGGGPTGLFFAACIKTSLGGSVHITVRESRWKSTNEGIRWMDVNDGINRREQVVTLQSAVISSLPSSVSTAVFPKGGYSCVWPTGGESPPSLGFPKNIRIMEIEDRLLDLACNLGINLQPGKVRVADVTLSDWDLVIFADGAGSKNRDFFSHKFGQADYIPYSIDGKSLIDTVLALRVQSNMRDPDTVALTIAQNRFLFNGIDGDGYLYMRLTEDEAKEVRGITSDGKVFTNCIQSQPCMMVINTDSNVPSCKTHGTQFVPAIDKHSLLWPRVREGLDLFHCSLSSVTVFRLSMESRPQYVTELTKTGSKKPVFGALIGDSANSIHFWPGRGLNHGVYSAVALSRCLHDRWDGRYLRSSDFTRYVATMSALQHRHKDRAWRAMVKLYEGRVTPVSKIVDTAIKQSTSINLDRNGMINVIMQRIERISTRLQPRLPMRPSVSAIKARLLPCSSETLNVLVQSGPWETRLSGGPEVDLDSLMPRKRENPVSTSDIETNGGETVSPQSKQTDSASIIVPLATGSMNMFHEREVLSEDSVRASFFHALHFAAAESLAWSEAVREIHALFIRADRGLELSRDDIEAAVEGADSNDSDRIEVDEFISAVQALLLKIQPRTDQLGEMWTQKFTNAMDNSNFVPARLAARMVLGISKDLEPILIDMLDKERLRLEFESRSKHDRKMVDLDLFLEVAAMVMFGH